MVDFDLSNNTAIWSWFSHTVSFSNRTSRAVCPSSVWYIFTSPLLSITLHLQLYTFQLLVCFFVEFLDVCKNSVEVSHRAIDVEQFSEWELTTNLVFGSVHPCIGSERHHLTLEVFIHILLERNVLCIIEITILQEVTISLIWIVEHFRCIFAHSAPCLTDVLDFSC